MSSTKSATGHLLGAAGAIEAIFSILAIRDNVAPPTLNLENPSRASAIDRVAKEAQERRSTSCCPTASASAAPTPASCSAGRPDGASAAADGLVAAAALSLRAARRLPAQRWLFRRSTRPGRCRAPTTVIVPHGSLDRGGGALAAAAA